MNTRSTLDLTDAPISDLQLISNSRRQIQSSETVDIDPNPMKDEIYPLPTALSNTFDHIQSTSEPLSIVMENDDLIELEEIKRKHSNLEKRFLDKLPIFKPSEEIDIEEFLSKAETIFEHLEYSDDNRVAKIEEKLDESFRPSFILWKKNREISWNDFKVEFPKFLHGSILPMTSTEDKKSPSMDYLMKNNSEEKCSLLNSLLLELTAFSGDANARQWFISIDSKFSELKLSMEHRMEILPYFLVGDATIWFNSNQEKIRSYRDFCRSFVHDYLQPDQASNMHHRVTVKSDQCLLQTPSIVNGSVVNNSPIDLVRTKTTSPTCHSILSSNANQNMSSFSTIVSPTISKALIDRFVKDPNKFHGAKEDVIGWIDEVEQQFTIMNLCDADKLSLIHICLKGEAHLWYRQNKEKFLSWSIFINEITKGFTSNLQRDTAFEKLKQYQQSIHQSANQYYNTMIKLMKQADPEMNETTKVQYLMNGLRPSLSTETRRNYPKTVHDFLTQAKIAEELTALNTNTTTNSMNQDEFQSSEYLSSVNIKNPPSSHTLRRYQQPLTTNNPDHHINHSPNHDRLQYPNRRHQLPSAPYEGGRFSQFRRPPPPIHSQQPHDPQRSPTTSNNDRYSKQDSRYPPQQQSTQHCFRCGSTKHQASHCYHFENRSQ